MSTVASFAMFGGILAGGALGLCASKLINQQAKNLQESDQNIAAVALLILSGVVAIVSAAATLLFGAKTVLLLLTAIGAPQLLAFVAVAALVVTIVSAVDIQAAWDWLEFKSALNL